MTVALGGEPWRAGGGAVCMQQEEGHSREWVLRDQHGSSVEIELAVAKVEVGGQWGISLPPSCEISHV